MPTPKPTPTPAAESDWETTGEKGDWNTEESAAKRENFDRSLKEDESKTFEVPQEPKTASRSGSVYSYGYREPKDKGVGKTEQVYDANYRVITPPYRQNAEQQTDEDESDQDWIWARNSPLRSQLLKTMLQIVKGEQIKSNQSPMISKS